MAEEIKVPEWFKLVIYVLEKFGVLAVLCGVMLWFMGTEFKTFRQDVLWSLQRSIRNERAIMQKLGIPIILDGDKNE